MVEEEAVVRPNPRRRSAPVKVARSASASRTAQNNNAPGWWDKPRVVNRLADALGLFGLLILFLAAAYWLLSRPVFPVRSVLMTTPMKQVTSAQIAYAARSSIKGNFFTVDIEEVRNAFEKLPWVKSAQVRRIWPDTLELSIEEQKAVAYWMDAESKDFFLLNQFGGVFDASSAEAMPVLSGPEGSSERVLHAYKSYAPLVEPVGQLKVLAVNERQAWTITLDNGLELIVGREQSGLSIEQMLTRFATVYPSVKSKIAGRVMQVDLRYPSGFSLKNAHAIESSAATSEATPKPQGADANKREAVPAKPAPKTLPQGAPKAPVPKAGISVTQVKPPTPAIRTTAPSASTPKGMQP